MCSVPARVCALLCFPWLRAERSTYSFISQFLAQQFQFALNIDALETIELRIVLLRKDAGTTGICQLPVKSALAVMVIMAVMVMIDVIFLH